MKTDAQEIKPVTFAPGDILFRENDASYHFFIIQEGTVEIFKTAPDGTHVVLALAGEGTSIGEFAMIDRLPRSATAQAKTNVKAVEVSEVAYRRLLGDLPDWAVSVMRGLVERLRNANEIIRSAAVDAKTRQQITSAEYDPDSSNVKVTGTKTKIDDDTPDLV